MLPALSDSFPCHMREPVFLQTGPDVKHTRQLGCGLDATPDQKRSTSSFATALSLGPARFLVKLDRVPSPRPNQKPAPQASPAIES